MEEKMIPQNIEAEQSVLGAMLIDDRAVAAVAARLKPEDFYRISHQAIYRAMLALHEKNTPVDLVTVVNELKEEGKGRRGVWQRGRQPGPGAAGGRSGGRKKGADGSPVDGLQ